jgi:hypothetical protein
MVPDPPCAGMLPVPSTVTPHRVSELGDVIAVVEEPHAPITTRMDPQAAVESRRRRKVVIIKFLDGSAHHSKPDRSQEACQVHQPYCSAKQQSCSANSDPGYHDWK